jgi:hypothetical protein
MLSDDLDLRGGRRRKMEKESTFCQKNKKANGMRSKTGKRYRYAITHPATQYTAVDIVLSFLPLENSSARDIDDDVSVRELSRLITERTTSFFR